MAAINPPDGEFDVLARGIRSPRRLPIPMASCWEPPPQPRRHPDGPRSAAAPVSTWPGAARLRPGSSGVLRALCALAAVLVVALWPAAAHARVNAGRAGTEQPRLWGVEIGRHAGTFARPTYLARMKHAGINAVVLDPRRLTLKELRATVKAAKAGTAVGDRAHPARAREGHEKHQGGPRDLSRVPQARSNPVRREYGLALGRDRAVAQQRFQPAGWWPCAWPGRRRSEGSAAFLRPACRSSRWSS